MACQHQESFNKSAFQLGQERLGDGCISAIMRIQHANNVIYMLSFIHTAGIHSETFNDITLNSNLYSDPPSPCVVLGCHYKYQKLLGGEGVPVGFLPIHGAGLLQLGGHQHLRPHDSDPALWVGDGLLQLSGQYQMRCRHYKYQMMHQRLSEDFLEGNPAWVCCLLQLVGQICLMTIRIISLMTCQVHYLCGPLRPLHASESGNRCMIPHVRLSS